jgi:hypothetical protein
MDNNTNNRLNFDPKLIKVNGNSVATFNGARQRPPGSSCVAGLTKEGVRGNKIYHGDTEDTELHGEKRIRIFGMEGLPG